MLPKDRNVRDSEIVTGPPVVRHPTFETCGGEKCVTFVQLWLRYPTAEKQIPPCTEGSRGIDSSKYCTTAEQHIQSSLGKRNRRSIEPFNRE